MGLGQLLQAQPERDDARAVDQVTENVLTLFGLSAEEAHRLCRMPLPDLEVDGGGGQAAS